MKPKKYQIRKVPKDVGSYWYDVFSRSGGLFARWEHEATYTTYEAARENVNWLRSYDEHHLREPLVVYDSSIEVDIRDVFS